MPFSISKCAYEIRLRFVKIVYNSWYIWIAFHLYLLLYERQGASPKQVILLQQFWFEIRSHFIAALLYVYAEHMQYTLSLAERYSIIIHFSCIHLVVPPLLQMNTDSFLNTALGQSSAVLKRCVLFGRTRAHKSPGCTSRPTREFCSRGGLNIRESTTNGRVEGQPFQSVQWIDRGITMIDTGTSWVASCGWRWAVLSCTLLCSTAQSVIQYSTVQDGTVQH